MGAQIDIPNADSLRTVKAGDLLYLTSLASVQFRLRPITVRVIRALTDRHTYGDWLWVEAYEIGPSGGAVARRELFVNRDGLRWMTPSAERRRAGVRSAVR